MEDVTLTQNWGARFLHFRENEATISKVEKSSTVLLELDWYGEGNVYFRFSLIGSADALAEGRSDCATP